MADNQHWRQLIDHCAGEMKTGAAGHFGAAGSGGNSDSAGIVSPDYYRSLTAWLEKHKRYPRRAMQRRQQGVVKVSFRIDREEICFPGRLSAVPAIPCSTKRPIRCCNGLRRCRGYPTTQRLRCWRSSYPLCMPSAEGVGAGTNQRMVTGQVNNRPAAREAGTKEGSKLPSVRSAI